MQKVQLAIYKFYFILFKKEEKVVIYLPRKLF